jgi:hypothetical protein
MSVIYPDQSTHTIEELKRDLATAKGGIYGISAGGETMSINAGFGAPGTLGVQVGMMRMKRATLDEITKEGGMLDTFIKENGAPVAPAPASSGWGGRRRKYSRKYCKKTPCRKMGFTQKASCRPHKNCFTRRVRRSGY